MEIDRPSSGSTSRFKVWILVCFELPSHPFCDLAVRFLEYASHQLSRLPLIGKMITGICLDDFYRAGQA